MLRSLKVCGLISILTALTWSSSARAGGTNEGEAMLYLGALAIFDLAALPIDIYYATKPEGVPTDYARVETVLGVLQASGGVLGTVLCASDHECANGAILPAILTFTAYTTAMAIHGGVSLALKPTRNTVTLAVSPMVTARSIGLSLGGTF
jgi:uncharacterized membrane protein (UPF0136 family)